MNANSAGSDSKTIGHRPSAKAGYWHAIAALRRSEVEQLQKLLEQAQSGIVELYLNTKSPQSQRRVSDNTSQD